MDRAHALLYRQGGTTTISQLIKARTEQEKCGRKVGARVTDFQSCHDKEHEPLTQKYLGASIYITESHRSRNPTGKFAI
jgi:hypothetical protein